MYMNYDGCMTTSSATIIIPILKRSNEFRVPIPAKPAERQFSFNDASPFLPCFYTSA